MINTDIFKLSVTEIAQKIKAKEVSSVELTQALLDYAKSINDKTNAYISFREEEALEEARQADKTLAEGAYLGVFHGIPMGIKDNIYLKDEVTTMGSKIHKDFKPTENAEVVSLLRKAGAVIIGKLNLHEYAWGVTNDSPHFGATHNPWDATKITGGSSGGSGASIATGSSFASVGTDTAGSVRIPASCCGIVGLKPTQQLVSREGVFPLSTSLDHVGPMGKTVSDVAALLGVLTDSKTDYMPQSTSDLKNYTIGINEDYYFFMLDSKVESIVKQGLEHLKSLGATIKPVKLPSMEYVPFVGYMTILSEAFALHEQALNERLTDFGEDLQGLYGMGIPNAVNYIKAQQLREVLKADFNAIFSEVDALYTPTLPCLPPAIGSQTVTINGEDLSLNDHIMRFMFPSNITGIPSLSLPGGIADGLPVGIQLIGAEFSEKKLLNIAKVLEKKINFDYRQVVDLVNS